MKVLLRFAVFTLLSAVLALPAFSQYFGQNKVRYDRFSFKVMSTPHFDIYFYPEEEPGLQEAARMAERWYVRHARVFGDTLRGRQPLILYGSHPQFEETNVIGGDIGQGTGGVTEPARRRIVLPFAPSLHETDHVIGHELVHAYQFDLSGRRDERNARGMAGLEQLPLWFVEGMAEYLSIGNIDANTAMWIRDAAQQKKLPDLGDLNNPEFFPYRYGQALLAYVGGRFGDRAVANIMVKAAVIGNVQSAIDSVLGITADSLVSAWHHAVQTSSDSIIAHTAKPASYGQQLISAKGGGRLNVAPAISPDGKQMVFFSERGLFSINLYLADAYTGEVTKTILRTELDPHYQSLEFISSAGAWSPDGGRFVFTATDQGRPFLSIINIKTDKVEREERFKDLGEIYSPTWSPDGKKIAFSALARGVTDLFVYDLETGNLRQLTNDDYADLQPAWSPDGQTIAFVTDRFTTNLSSLSYGPYELATINASTGAIKRLWATAGERNINPQWSRDGKSLLFLADPDGITNIYRIDLASGELRRLTNLSAGVSGITALSPALSVAEDADRLVYSTYEGGAYTIYAIDSAEVLRGKTYLHDAASLAAATLPPADRTGDIIENNLHTPARGLPADAAYAANDYRPSLALEGVAQPTAAVGVDRFGTYGGGGVALLWGDLLGNHYLSTALQVMSGGGHTDIAGLVGYINSTGRVSWGGMIQQMPYNTGFFNAGVTTINGQEAYVEQTYLDRQTDRDVMGLLSYPFSQIMRTDLAIGYRNISFSRSVDTRAVSLATGEVLVDDTQDQPHPRALNLATASAALVFDNSIFGATDPLLGQRFRLEVDPTFGSLRWVDVIADYRRYIMPVRPLTLAGRIMHIARYGRDAESEMISPVFLGYPGLVRGYDINTWSASDSSVFSRTVGSKALIANAELRFPLFGLLGLGKGYFGFLPLEVGVFYDAGVAWNKGSLPSLLGGGVKAVSSTGFVARLNFFGYLIAQADYVHPLDHPSQQWLWQFSLVEGF